MARRSCLRADVESRGERKIRLVELGEDELVQATSDDGSDASRAVLDELNARLGDVAVRNLDGLNEVLVEEDVLRANLLNASRIVIAVGIEVICRR